MFLWEDWLCFFPASGFANICCTEDRIKTSCTYISLFCKHHSIIDGEGKQSSLWTKWYNCCLHFVFKSMKLITFVLIISANYFYSATCWLWNKSTWRRPHVHTWSLSICSGAELMILLLWVGAGFYVDVWIWMTVGYRVNQFHMPTCPYCSCLYRKR